MTLRYSLLGAFALALVVACWDFSSTRGAPPPSAAPKKQPNASFVRDVVPFLRQHCYRCHGNGKSRGDLTLDKYKDDESIVKDRKVWENVVQMVRGGEMPPKERPRPPVADREAVLRAIDAVFARFDCGQTRNPGRVTLRRLNRSEYNNTIRDLVGIDFQPAADFPADDVGYGFDNIGDVLSLSPLLLEKYLIAADAILDRAIVILDPPKPAKSRLGGLRIFPQSAGELRRFDVAVLRARGQVGGQNFFEEGDYTIRIEAYAEQVGEEPVRAALRINREEIKEFKVKAEKAKPETLEAKVRLKTGSARISLSFVNPSEDKDKQKRQLVIRNIVLDGPYNPPPPKLPESHRRIMAHKEGREPRPAAREILTRFATRAFRRPVTDAEIERLLKLYDRGEKEGERFEDRVRLALSGVLVSPYFLFRVERDPPGVKPGEAYPIGEHELASRLSYFLWSTMPDEELFSLAARNELRKNLDRQIGRMLADPKSVAFEQNFAGQWLTLNKLDSVTPDAKTFPGFDAELRDAMRKETELFFAAVVKEDRGILDLLDADFSFVNERLARHYGIEGVKGKDFQRVKLPANRGGILTHASILTLTSNPTRTSPVKRGKWVLDQILNTPPPPPPPDVPELKEEKRLTGSLRQVMEMHRANAVCASCHQKMDPIGFAFENFDAVGAWRDRDGKAAIDPSGTLPGGRSFKGPAELKTILKGKKDLFGRCLTEKMLTYALGRGLEHYDRCAVDKILDALSKNEYRFSVLVRGVVHSDPFQMRTATGGKR
ncbi:MAG TPA: DUF1592 domain-containing protein [Gemmataceae bacterium]|jgi:mono/diheme cytochrome c family protein